MPNTLLTRLKTELYVEVGHGLAPAAMSNIRRYDGNRAYLGIDKAEGNYAPVDSKDYGQQVSEWAAKAATYFATEKPDESISFIKADGRNLPLADASTNEVYMANLLTSPIIRGDQHRILTEVERVLKPGGIAVAKMSWEPEWLSPQHEVVRWLQDAHLDITAITGASDTEGFGELEKLYGVSQHQYPDSYYVVATKPAA